jgi:hypothetical protein
LTELPWLEPPSTVTLELPKATMPDSLLVVTVEFASVTWASFWATTPLPPPEIVRPDNDTRCAPLTMTASWPLPLIAAVPLALRTIPLERM